MPVDVETMRSEVNIQPSSTPVQNTSAGAAPPVDMDQLREIIRGMVMEIVSDDIYSTFRLRGM